MEVRDLWPIKSFLYSKKCIYNNETAHEGAALADYRELHGIREDVFPEAEGNDLDDRPIGQEFHRKIERYRPLPDVDVVFHHLRSEDDGMADDGAGSALGTFS